LSNLAQESLGHPVNLMSHKQVAIAIYDELKLIPSLPTKTAKVKSDKKQSDRSTSAKVLLSMMGQHIFPSVVKGKIVRRKIWWRQIENDDFKIEYRQIQKLHAWVTGLHQYSDRVRSYRLTLFVFNSDFRRIGKRLSTNTHPLDSNSYWNRTTFVHFTGNRELLCYCSPFHPCF
jgi:hypothetical protein